MTGLVFIGVLYYSVRVHTSGFGSYKQLLPLIAIANWSAQLIAITGISIGIITGHDNVFTSPEFAFGSDGKTWFHLGAHVFIGTTVGSVFPWLIGCLIMFITKKLLRNTNTKATVQV